MPVSDYEQAPPRPFPERVGRYELLLPIGTGGMATVYLARIRGAGGFTREVALKLIHAHLRDLIDPSHGPLEEAKLASRIRHPNAVPVLDVGDDAFGMFLVMDYVEGDSLAGLYSAVAAKDERLPTHIGLRIVCDALAGLHAAHELRDDAGNSLGIVHRDFSPQNILVGIDGTTRLTDFGIAKATSRTHVTEPGLIKGKIRYMAPEQARAGRIDRRADVWAAGVVAWEVLAGRRLLPPGDDLEALLKVVTEDAPRLHTVRPDISPRLDDVVARALVRDIEARCPTADELRRDLIDAFRSEGGLADATEVASFVRCFSQRKLDNRRTKVAQVLRLRSEMGSVIAAPLAEDPSSSPQLEGREQLVSSIPIRQPSDTAALPTTTWSPPAPTRGSTRPDGSRRRTYWLTAALAGSTLIAALAYSSRKRTPIEEPTTPEANAPTTAVAVTSEMPAREGPRQITLSANAPVAQVKLGTRVVTVAPPAAEVLVYLEAEDESAPEISAIAADGRAATARIQAGDRRLAIAFGPQTTAEPPMGAIPKRSPPPKRRPAAAAEPEPVPLATSPYGKKP
jgi:serine/threonine-protein kinase